MGAQLPAVTHPTLIQWNPDDGYDVLVERLALGYPDRVPFPGSWRPRIRDCWCAHHSETSGEEGPDGHMRCSLCHGTEYRPKVRPESPLSWCPKGTRHFAAWIALSAVLHRWELWSVDAEREGLFDGRSSWLYPRRWLMGDVYDFKIAMQFPTCDDQRAWDVVAGIVTWMPPSGFDGVVVDDESRLVHLETAVRCAGWSATSRGSRFFPRWLAQWRSECERRLLACWDGRPILDWDRTIIPGPTY